MEAKSAKNENGSAVIIVLIFLGIISMIGVGLLLQSQLDLQFASALTGTDHRLDLSETGLSYMFPLPPNMDGQQITSAPRIVATPDPNSPSETYYWSKVPSTDQTDLRRTYIGPASLSDCTGYEIGRSGDYRPSSTNKYYFVLNAISGVRPDATVSAKVTDRSLQQTVIQMGCLRCQ